MDFKGTRVLVLDGYGKQVPAILTQLHELGCVITTLNFSKMDVGYASRYPKYKLLEPKAEHDTAYLEQVIDREVKSGKYDVVFPMLETATNILLKNAEEYNKYVKIAAAPLDAFMLAFDKQNTMRICQEIGVPCPLTRMDGEDVAAFADKVSFPLAIKPRMGTGSIGFKRIPSKEKLLEIIENGTIDPDEYIIQECVVDFKVKYITNLFFDEKGEVKSSLTAEIKRWYPVDSGPATAVYTVDRPDITEYSIKLMKAMNWRGLCNVCYLLEPKDNTPKILEINGRVPASVKIMMFCGIDIVRQELELALGCPVTDYGENTKFGYQTRQGQKDLLWFLKSPDRFKVKNPSYFNRRHMRDVTFSWKDPLPYFAFLFGHLGTYKSDMKKRERNV